AAHHGLSTAAYSFDYVAGWAVSAARVEQREPADIIRDTGQRVRAAAAAVLAATDPASHGGRLDRALPDPRPQRAPDDAAFPSPHAAQASPRPDPRSAPARAGAPAGQVASRDARRRVR